MPPIQIDKILSDPLLLVSAVLLIVSPILFLIALVKYFRTPKAEPFAIPHHEMESPIPTPKEISEPSEEHKAPPLDTASEPAAPLVTLRPAPTRVPEPAAPPAAETMSTPPPPMPPRPRREESAAEKTVVMPPGVAEMQSEMEIALTQLRLLNKRVANLEQELARLRGSSSGPTPPSPV